MSGHGVPSVYQDATHLDPDSNAKLALARAQWIDLENRAPAQAHALKYAQPIRGGHRVAIEGVTKATFAALVRKGFAVKHMRLLTGNGEMLREAAMYSPP
jgi:hypothetical protein